MHTPDKIAAFADTVCDQIRWKKARVRVSEEITNHVTDTKNAFIEQGIDEAEAVEKAITDTGDATEIGMQLDRIHRPKPQWGMFTVTVVLLAIGILIRLFIYNNEDMTDPISVRLFYTAIGVAGMLIVYFADFSIIGKYPKTVLIGMVLLMLITLRYSPYQNGKLYYGQFVILLYPVVLAAVLFATRNKGFWGVFLCVFTFMVLCCASLLVPSLSGLGLLIIVGFSLFGIAVYKKWFGIKRAYGALLMLTAISLIVLVFSTDVFHNMKESFSIAVNPSLESHARGYFSLITRELVGGAKWSGRGTISGIMTDALADPSRTLYSESLLTMLISEYGWAAFTAIMGVFLFFIIKGFMLCFKQKGSLGFFMSFAIMTTLTYQVITYVVFNLGFQFVTPLSLPLISDGNTATIVNLVLIGLMLSIFRTGDAVLDGKAPENRKLRKIFVWEDGALTIYFKA